MREVRSILERTKAFEREAHRILGVHESSKSRVVLLEETYKRLGGLSLRQDELFREALRCVENSLFRAAHVLAWSGFIDHLEQKLASDGFRKLKKARAKWTFSSVEDLREHYPEFQIVQASKDVGLASRNEVGSLLGLLSKRHECAHPSDYFPALNDTLGYISELLRRIQAISNRKL